MDVAIIEKEALLLPEGQRALLADRLLESLSPIPSKLQEAWIKESDSRMSAFRAGEILALDGPHTISTLRARFRK
ncbi:MAG: addiction module protein [Verrucomicrobium sp.]